MTTESEIEAALSTAVSVGRLKGKNEVLREQLAERDGRLDGMQDDLDLMRERAARSEGLLAQAQQTLNEMSAAVDGHWKERKK